MKSAFKGIVGDTIIDNMIDNAVMFAKKDNLGILPTGCEIQRISVYSMLYHCVNNDVMFNNNQFKVISDILNSI